MILTLRAYFLSRLLREKVLLLGLLLIGALWWLSAFGTRAGRFWREQRDTTVRLAEQQQWLNNRVKIAADEQRAAARFEAAKTLDGTRLVDALNQAAHDAGLRNNYSSEAPTTDTSGQFKVHSVDFTVRQADYLLLQRFYLNLHQRAPYLGIERVTLSPNLADGSKVTLVLRASAVEVQR